MITRSALLLTAAAITANAASISVNLNSQDGASDGIEAGQVAGLAPYAASNWNNVGGGDLGAASGLNDSNGVATTAAVSWTAAGGWGDGTANADVGTNPNADLVRGYLDDNFVTGVSLTLTGIPYDAYDVVVYFSSDDLGGADWRPASFTGTDTGTATTVFSASGTAPGPIQQWGTTGGDLTSNTLVVTGGSGDQLVITTPGRSAAGNRGSIAGFQIVQVPEPSSAALFGLAGVGLLLRRRK